MATGLFNLKFLSPVTRNLGKDIFSGSGSGKSIGTRFLPSRSIFQSSLVLREMRKVTTRFLFGFGAYTRGVARRSLGKPKSVSKPGNPPASHTGVIKRSLLFGVERDSRNVVIGPSQEHPAVPQKARNKKGVVPPILEYGGILMMFRKRAGKKVPIKYTARPFMGPAFEIAKANLSTIWGNAAR